MNPIAIFIGLILLGTASMFVFKPFRERQWPGSKKSAPALRLEQARTAALTALRDLDFDFQTGKVSEEDHAALREQLVAEAARYVTAETDQDDRLEAMIRARKAAATDQKPCPRCGGQLDATTRFCPQCGAEVGMACPSCGKSVKVGDLFCRSCGSKLELRAEATA
jgi:double zinc ribbon protein